MARIRWNPLRDYDLLRREMDRLFDEFPRRYDKDVLKVSLPKQDETKPKKIEIKVGK